MNFRPRIIWSLTLSLFAIFFSLSCGAAVSLASTGTIDYVATDTWGNTATSTRTIIVDAAPSIAPTNEASTAASTTP